MPPNRRALLVGLAALAAGSGLQAHTPYGQWVVYRRKHLLIGSHRGDLRTYELAQRVVEILHQQLPEAKARIARGPRPQRIASLMATGQLFLAVMSRDEAALMAVAAPPFEGYRPVDLQQMTVLEAPYALYASPELRGDHAWLVLDALAHGGMAGRPAEEAPTLHPGAKIFWSGGPLPAASGSD